MQKANIDSRIGALSNGLFYAFVNGHGNAETVGTRMEVEAALGMCAVPSQIIDRAPDIWRVRLAFQHPAWDEADGLYYEVFAHTKSQANAIARKNAADDGHIGAGKGRCTFSAVKVV